MFEKFLNFFREGTSESNMRLNATLMTVTICIAILWLTIVTGANLWEAFISLFAIAMGAKLAQKYAENKEVKTGVQDSTSTDGKN